MEEVTTNIQQQEQQQNEILERGFDLLLEQKDWNAAVVVFNEILLPSTQNFNLQKDVICTALLGHLICTFHTDQYSETVADAKRLLKSLNVGNQKTFSTEMHARYYHLQALVKLKSFEEAEYESKNILDVLKSSENHIKLKQLITECQILLENLIKDSDSEENMKDLNKIIEETGNFLFKELPFDDHSKWLQHKSQRKESDLQKDEKEVKKDVVKNGDDSSKGSEDNEVIRCTYCGINFLDKNDLRMHCQTEAHQNILMSDEGEILYVNFVLTFLTVESRFFLPLRGTEYQFLSVFSHREFCRDFNHCFFCSTPTIFLNSKIQNFLLLSKFFFFFFLIKSMIKNHFVIFEFQVVNGNGVLHHVVIQQNPTHCVRILWKIRYATMEVNVQMHMALTN